MSRWQGYKDHETCPVCDHKGHCGHTEDGAVRCMRVQEPPADWRRVKDTDAEGGTVFRRSDEPVLRSPLRQPKKATGPYPDRIDDARRCSENISDQQVQQLAEELGVTPDSLRSIGVGWDKTQGSFTFPEKDADRRVIGVNRRHLDGSKKMPHGHHRGLVIPAGFDSMPDPVFVPEGPTDVAAHLTIGLNAVGRPSNTGGVKHLAELLKDRAVIFVLGEQDQRDDGDYPGLKGAHAVARGLSSAWGKPVQWAMPPDKAKDVRAWLNGQASADDEARHLAGAEFHKKVKAGSLSAEPRPKVQAYSQASELVKFTESAELFHNADGDAFATIPIGDHRQTWPVNSRGLRRWLGRRFYLEHGRVPSSQAIQEAMNVIEGRGCYDGPEHEVHVRVAGHNGAVYLDLADERWRVVVITTNGWRVVVDPPVRFRRSRGMLPLPVPVAGGTFDDLRPFVNVRDDADFVLLVGFIVGALRDRGPYPILIINGEQDSCKSTTCRVARRLLDPNKSDLRAEPRDVRDLMITANNSRCLALENMSAIPLWLSDALCRLSTGGGFGTRELCTDADEIIFDAQRPVLINGIEELATRGDLLDRTIRLMLPTIDKNKRRDEAEFWSAFEQARPRILGALLDAVSAALRNIGETKLDDAPRMADFAKWVVAAENALPWRSGSFLAAYADNRESAHELALEAAPVADTVRSWIEEKYRHLGWSGTATQLLEQLNRHAGFSGKVKNIKPPKGWPSKPHVLSGMLRRAAPNLRAIGVDVDFGRRGKAGTRTITISHVGANSVSSVSRVSNPPDDAEEADLADAKASGVSVGGASAKNGADAGRRSADAGTPVERQPENAAIAACGVAADAADAPALYEE